MGRRLPVEPLTPRGIVETADAAAAEADERLAELAAAARAGDDSVSQEDLEAAEKQSAWARVQAIAARPRAERRAQEIREEQWAALRDDVLTEAVGDEAAEVEALLEQARTILRKAVQLGDRRNVAIWTAARYVAEGGWSPDGVHLTGSAPRAVPGASYIEYGEGTYRYRPATSVVRDMLRPMKRELTALSGNAGDAFLSTI